MNSREILTRYRAFVYRESQLGMAISDNLNHVLSLEEGKTEDKTYAIPRAQVLQLLYAMQSKFYGLVEKRMDFIDAIPDPEGDLETERDSEVAFQPLTLEEYHNPKAGKSVSSFSIYLHPCAVTQTRSRRMGGGDASSRRDDVNKVKLYKKVCNQTGEYLDEDDSPGYKRYHYDNPLETSPWGWRSVEFVDDFHYETDSDGEASTHHLFIKQLKPMSKICKMCGTRERDHYAQCMWVSDDYSPDFIMPVRPAADDWEYVRADTEPIVLRLDDEVSDILFSYTLCGVEVYCGLL